MPSEHSHLLGRAAHATRTDAVQAIDAALAAAPGWAELGFEQRAAVFLRAADLLAGPWRDTLNVTTMLGQGKTVQQAEIDAACELIDFWRFNVAFARQILADQPISSLGVWNRADYRPLEGFVYAITRSTSPPLRATSPTSPGPDGERRHLEAEPDSAICALHHAAVGSGGSAACVINYAPGDGLEVPEVALRHRDLAGIHFTGSTKTFQHLWQSVGANIAGYRAYPQAGGGDRRQRLCGCSYQCEP
jgi:1-pyrroline-5-carboxylate dehydrogenase